VGAGVDCADLDRNTIADCLESLLENSTFNADIRHWKPEARAALTWNRADALASGNSGSIEVQNAAPSSNADVGLVYTGATQCVAISKGASSGEYALYAQTYSANSSVVAYGSISARPFASADCTGTPLSVNYSPTQGTLSLWVTITVSVPVVESARSLLVELSVGKLATIEEPVALRFDNILVR
jgi:hypothetical protein